MTCQEDHLRTVRESKRITIWLDDMPLAVGIEEMYLLLRRALESDSLEPIEVTVRVESRLRVPGSWRVSAPGAGYGIRVPGRGME